MQAGPVQGLPDIKKFNYYTSLKVGGFWRLLNSSVVGTNPD